MYNYCALYAGEGALPPPQTTPPNLLQNVV